MPEKQEGAPPRPEQEQPPYTDESEGTDHDDDNIDDVEAASPSAEENVALAVREDFAVGWLRLLVALLLGLVALAVCLSVYFVTRNDEQQDFEDDFRDTSGKVVETFATTMNQRFEILDNFAVDMSSRVSSDPDHLSWPFATFPDYGIRAGNTAKLGTFLDITLLPMVQTAQLEQWNNYSMANGQWVAESLGLQEGTPEEEVEGVPPMGPVTYLDFQTNEFFPTNSSEIPGPYYPKWQSYPAVRTVYNVDIGYGSLFVGPIEATIDSGNPVFTKSIDTYELEDGSPRRQAVVDLVAAVGGEYQDDAFAPIFYPVFESIYEKKKVVAVIRAAIYWKTYFEGILPGSSKGIVVVLESENCGSLYSYRIDGSKATPLGRGDLHDTKYDYLEASVTIDNILGIEPSDDTGTCLYGVRVYPSQPLEDEHKTNKPLFFTIALAAVFLVTCGTFLVYDYCVQRRQAIVMKSAQQSGKIVHSLFPTDVRNKLYAEQEAKAKQDKDTWERKEGDGEMQPKEAIASLYPKTTIFFADISGFTAWSSTRAPKDVFQLLETIYGAFDKIAERLKVFKVETIGDCYVAVTGLPDPQLDHAVIMVKFARECMTKLHALRPELMDMLGPDAGDLSMRVGLHSGPVTAGVLRGQKARFRLFGDTVNTASRMESNGMPDHIHVSQPTADELIQAGKQQWLVPREGTVSVKSSPLVANRQ